ncbi:hypothetical protein CYMTET_9084 [Cymbomonas tetramitiformis]|uniref:Uncharacterized protein n=1 Tax=Cymbomonas tetramitiformis TaxID=36881 RepID=A0AAE0GRT6_9CHLO|nr:hypothetical protein CYMTET_9084 [Cymbomonas tetramitiformis]
MISAYLDIGRQRVTVTVMTLMTGRDNRGDRGETAATGLTSSREFTDLVSKDDDEDADDGDDDDEVPFDIKSAISATQGNSEEMKEKDMHNESRLANPSAAKLSSQEAPFEKVKQRKIQGCHRDEADDAEKDVAPRRERVAND